jgi:hypothetical protein
MGLLENCRRLDYNPDQPRDENGRFGEAVLGAAKSISTKTGAIRLADVRDKLPHLSRSQQDVGLTELHAGRKIALYRDDNTPKVTARDHAAAIHVGGNPRHILYVK